MRWTVLVTGLFVSLATTVCADDTVDAGHLSTEDANLIRFVTIPPEGLLDDIRLIERFRTAPLIPVTRNPEVLTDRKGIKYIAAFFGILGEADLKLVRAAVVAIYQEKDDSHEMGIYGLHFFERKAALKWFRKIERNYQGVAKDKKNPPFLLKDTLLLYVWKDSVTDSAFEAVLESLKRAKLEPVSRESDKP